MDGIEKKDMAVGAVNPHSFNSSISSITIQPSEDLEKVIEANATQEPNLSRQISRLSSRLASAYPQKVPRNERRGLLARFTIVPEVADPVQYPRKTKWVITFIVALAAMAAPMGSAIIMPCLTPIAEDFNVSPTITNLSVALYMLAMGIFPLWWSSFSETLGRRTIYITSFLLFTLFGALSAVANSIGMLIAMRMLSGGAAASVQAVGAGTIADIWESEERGTAMGYFFLGPLCGPLLAPIIGGALAQGFNWRSTQWFTAIYGLVVITLIIFCLPETLEARKSLVEQTILEVNNTLDAKPPTTGELDVDKPSNGGNDGSALQRTVTQQSVANRSKVTMVFLKRAFVDPLRIVLLLRFPVVAITVYYASITFGSLFFLNISIEDTFSRSPHNFNVFQVGLCYIPASFGYFLASIFGGQWLDHIMKREARKAGRYDSDGSLVFRPEDRMKENAWVAAIAYPCAMLWYGWAAQAQVHWAGVLLSNFFFGCGSMIVFAMVTTMLTEFVPKQSSTGLAVNIFIRNIFSCVGTIAAHPIIHAIGNGWMFTILCVVALVSGCVVIWAMKTYGYKWREEMDRQMED